MSTALSLLSLLPNSPATPFLLVFISSVGWKENERHGNASQPLIRSTEAYEIVGRKPEQKPVGDQASDQPGPQTGSFGELGLWLVIP